MKRRSFVKYIGTSIAMAGLGIPVVAQNAPSLLKLTILHTNDVHSRIEPFPMDGGKRQGLGGAARRAKLISEIRAQSDQVLLLDAGDIFQGTPYFNYFSGELEFKLMSKMGYDAATIGNHDFDAGIEGLAKQLPLANFELINCNYALKNTPLESTVKPYKVFQKGKIRVGVLGVGIELDGLVPTKLYGETRYLDPIKNANKYAAILKHDEKCDYVICLSHLGYKYENDKLSDVLLAQNSKDINLIIGGHTHTFMEQPDKVMNLDGKEVLINQAGWAGIMLGQIDVYFERNFKKSCYHCKNKTIKGD